MEIKRLDISSFEKIAEIYAEARSFMRMSGNLKQWVGGYPSADIIKEDISKNRLYACMENGEILGIFCFFIGDDPTYDKIYEGAWLNSEPYGVIHRIAVSKQSHGKGIAKQCFDYCFEQCRNLKIDTHRDNIPMQKALLKNGFSRCGIIYLQNGDERIAYQKA